MGDVVGTNGVTQPYANSLPAMPDELEVTELANVDLSQILSEKSIAEIREAFGGEDEVEIPLIDAPDFKATVKIDLARMTMILSIESDAEQAKNIQDIIKADQGNIKARCEARMKKTLESLEKMDEAAKASLFNKIFGWLMVAIAVVAAVAMSVASGGVALGPVVGALMGLTFQILNETKVTEKVVKALADSIQDTFGCDKATAKMWASIVWTACQLIASVLGGLGGNWIASAANNGANAATTVLRTAKQAFDALSENLQAIITVVGTVSGELGIFGTAWSTYANYDAAMTEAETTKFTALIQMLQKMLEDDEELLKALMELLNQSPQELASMLESALDAEKQIGENMGYAPC